MVKAHPIVINFSNWSQVFIGHKLRPKEKSYGFCFLILHALLTAKEKGSLRCPIPSLEKEDQKMALEPTQHQIVDVHMGLVEQSLQNYRLHL